MTDNNATRQPGEFSLWDQPWIPVRMLSGELLRVGFRDALTQAHEISHPECSNPLADLVVTRLLIALAARIHAAPTHSNNLGEWDTWADNHLAAGQFNSSAIDSYGNKWHDRFFLFHPEFPFLQDPALVTDCPKTSKLNKLFLDTPAGNNPLFWDNGEKHLDTEERTVAPEAAAEALLVQSQYAAGGKCTARSGESTAKSAPLRAASVYLWRGATLFETLLLNAVPSRGDDEHASRDQCVWEHGPAERQSDGFFGRLTDTNRGLLLVGDATGVSDFYLTVGATSWEPPTRWDAMVAVRHPGPKPKAGDEERPLRLTDQASAWADTSALVSAVLLTKVASIPSSLGRNIIPPPIFASRAGNHRRLSDALMAAAATVTTHHADKSKDVAWSCVDLGALHSFLAPSQRSSRRKLRRFCGQAASLISDYRYSLRIAFGEPPADAGKLADVAATQSHVATMWAHAYTAFLAVADGGDPAQHLAEIADECVASFDQVTALRASSDLRLATLVMKGRARLLWKVQPHRHADRPATHVSNQVEHSES